MVLHRLQYGLTLIEALVAMAILCVMTAIAFPISVTHSERENLSLTHDRFSYALEKSILTAVTNEHYVNPSSPAATLCRSESNQLRILQASEAALPNCSTGSGTTVWKADLPPNVDIQSNGETVQCMCFNPEGFLTSNNCLACATTLPIEFRVTNP